MSDSISREALIKETQNCFVDGKIPHWLYDLIANAPAIKQDKQVSSWAWALIMETAASFEVASYSISDKDAKKSAEGAIKYARDGANKYYTTPQPPQEQGELVKKAVADALEEAAKLCRKKAEDYASLAISSNEVKDFSSASICTHKKAVALGLEDKIRALIKRNA